MKILMMVSGSPHSTITHRLVALGRELVSRGHSVSMIAPSMDRHSNWKVDRPEQMDGITMIYPGLLPVKSQILSLVPYLFTASWALLRHNADVVYVSKATPATAPALLAKWFKRTPIVVDVDDMGFEVMRLEGRSPLMWGAVAACEWLVEQQAKAIVPVSSYLEQRYSARFGSGKLIKRVPNGVDTGEFEALQPEVGRIPKLVFFAMLGRTEILAPVLEALPHVIEVSGRASVKLEVLGDGPSRPELETLARSLGVSDNVHFRGWATFGEVRNYAAAGDIGICVMPDQVAVAAASNQKVFQYEALELAPVVTRVGDLPEYVDYGRAGVVVEPGDIEGLSKALNKLLADPALRERLGKRGRQLAETRYSWKRLALKVEELLKEVVK